MNSILSQNLFFVKEHLGIFKVANNYEIYNPETKDMIITCSEEKLGFFKSLNIFGITPTSKCQLLQLSSQVKLYIVQDVNRFQRKPIQILHP